MSRDVQDSGNTSRRVARNTAWFTIGSILQKIISFAYFTGVAMVFGVSGTGRYFLALTFTALFTVVADWGIAAVLTREIARDRSRIAALFAPALTIRSVMILLTVACITIIARIFGYPIETRVMIGIATVSLVLDAVHILLYALLRGIQRVHYEAMGLVIGQAVLAFSGVMIFIFRAGLHVDGGDLVASRTIHGAWLLLPYILMSCTNVVIALFGCMRESVLIFDRRFITRAAVRWFFRISTPFALTAGLSRIYTYSDTFLLSIITGELAVAYYSTPFKITFAFQFIPLSFIAALYPAMSALATRSREQLAALFVSAIRFLLLIALPIAFGIGVLATRIVTDIYGADFLPSIPVLIILIISLPFVFVNFPAGYLLNACDRQAVNTKLVALATIVNIGCNFVLIPLFGVNGAAISAVIATIVLTAANAIAVRRVVKYNVHAIFDATLRIVVASLIMSAVLAFARKLPLMALVVIGIATYGAAVFTIRAVSWTEVSSVFASFRHRKVLPNAVDVV